MTTHDDHISTPTPQEVSNPLPLTPMPGSAPASLGGPMICSLGGRLKGACGVASASAARPLTQPPSRKDGQLRGGTGDQWSAPQPTKTPALRSVAGTGKTYLSLALATVDRSAPSVDDLGRQLGKSARAVRDDLKSLESVGLARRVENNKWVAEHRDKQELAYDLGVVGVAATRAATHRKQRLDHAVRRIKARLVERGIQAVDQPAYDPAR